MASHPPATMAEQLARIFGTEEDRVNCPFYFKIGACRNGDQCNRLHNRPTMSQTLLLSHMYPNTPEALALANDEPWDDDMYDRAQQHLEAYYVEVFLELANYGEIEDLVVVDNLCDHMIGNVYVKYYHEEDAERALGKLTGRFYSGKLIQAEYTTVSDFREARCRAFHETRCNRGAYCNFMHIKRPSRDVCKRLGIRTTAAPLLRPAQANAEGTTFVQHGRIYSEANGGGKAPIITIFDHRGCQRGGENKEYTGAKSGDQDDEMCVKLRFAKLPPNINAGNAMLNEVISFKAKGIDGPYTSNLGMRKGY